MKKINIKYSDEKNELKNNPDFFEQKLNISKSTNSDLESIINTGKGKTPEQIENIVSKLKNQEILKQEEINSIISKITTNHPTLGMLTNLSDGDKYETVIFSGIKLLNDTISQNFTDKVLNSFKHNLLNLYPGVVPIWDDYKNLVLKINDGTTPSKEVLNNLLNETYSYYLGQEAKVPDNIPKLTTISEAGKIEGNSHEDVMYSLAQTRSNLEKKILGDKLLSIPNLVKFKNNISQKYNSKSSFYQKMTDDRGRTEYQVNEGLLFKEYTITNTGKKVTDKFIILDTNGNINSDIIKFVRKVKIPNSLSLFTDVEKINKSAIAHGEFIGPYIKKEGLKEGEILEKEELSLFKEIVAKLKSGIILNKDEIKHLEELTTRTYKGAMDKETFCYNLDKPGELFYIDIAGMGDINIKDFIRKIELFNNGKITKRELLLNSGDYMTNKFQHLLINLKNDLSADNINYYVGGDEICIFLEGEKETNINTIKIINDSLDSNYLEGRITKKLISENDLERNGKDILEEVDKLGLYSKIIETRIDEAINKVRSNLKDIIIFEEYDKIQLLKLLKKFDISIINGEKYITFSSYKGRSLLNGGNIFPLKNIIDLSTKKLLPYPDSPLIAYLKDNNLER